jgi:hypothetical protein
VFRNLTHLLHYLGYKRFEKEPEKAYTVGISTFFQRGVRMDVRCYRWKGLRGADLRDADLRGADLSGVWLWDTDLPQLDEAVEEYGIELVEPEVYSIKTCELLKYNSKTNRAE